jgi:hypothetical protein
VQTRDRRSASAGRRPYAPTLGFPLGFCFAPIVLLGNPKTNTDMFVLACGSNIPGVKDSRIRKFLSPRRKGAKFGIVVISTRGRYLPDTSTSFGMPGTRHLFNLAPAQVLGRRVATAEIGIVAIRWCRPPRQLYATAGNCPATEPGVFSALVCWLAAAEELPIYFRCLHDHSVIGGVTAIVPAPVLGRICRIHCGDSAGAAGTRCPGASAKSTLGVVLHHNCRCSPCFVERLFPKNSLP